jgi:hypothetical protein
MEDPEKARPLKKTRFEDQVDPEVERPGLVMKRSSPRESSIVEELEAASKVAASAQDAIYNKAFTNILANMRKFLGTSSMIQEVLLKGEGQPSREATVTFEDSQALMVRPLSSVPAKVVHLSDSEVDQPLDIDQILKDVAFKRMVETPLTMVAPEPTKVGESSKPNYSEPMDMEPPTVKDALITEERGKEGTTRTCSC